MRTAMRGRLQALKPLARSQEEELVNAAVVSDLSWREADTVLVFKGVRHEISVVSATNAAWRQGIRVCFPRVADGQLHLHEVSGWGELAPGAFGIPEPVASCPLVSPASVDIALVPGLAFTPRGRRLGQGGGFYDRLLPTLGGTTWGVAFACQVVEDVPTQPHDRPVDRVVSPVTLDA